MIQMMTDAEEVGKNRHIDIGVVGDVKASMEQVMDGLRVSGYRSPGREWLEEVMTEDKALKEPDQAMLNSDQTPIHPMRLMKELRDFLDWDATVVGDGGDVVTFAARVLGINKPGHWLDPGQFGCLGPGSGFAVAGAVGAAGEAGGHSVRGRGLWAERHGHGEHGAPQAAGGGHSRQQRRMEPDHPGSYSKDGSRHWDVPLPRDPLRSDNAGIRGLRRASNGSRPRYGLRWSGRLPPAQPPCWTWS